MLKNVSPGGLFPDYELPDHTGRQRRLSAIQDADPMIVMLGRGSYCPKDRRQLERLTELHREMEVGYCRLVTITTDPLLETNELRLGLGAHWPFLSDPERRIQRDLDIAEYTDPKHNPMIPHTIVLEPGLVVYNIYNGYWYFGRPTLDELRHDLREVSRRHRPDWDPTQPELKAAWARGERERFYPYGRALARVFAERNGDY